MKGLSAAYICSDEDSDEIELMKQDVIAGKVQLLFNSSLQRH